jgi:hypothetical protein
MSQMDKKLKARFVPFVDQESNKLITVRNAQGDNVIKPIYQGGHKHQNDVYDVVQPPVVAAPSTTLTAAQTIVDFQIQPTDQVVDEVVLEIEAAETGGSASVTPCPVPLMIQRLEIWGNSGSTLLQTIFGQVLYLMNGLLFTNEQLTNISSTQNFNNTMGGVTAIASNGNASYYCPLFLSFIGQDGKFPLNCLKGYLLFRFYFQPSVETGTGVLSVKGMNLHLFCHDIPMADKQDLKNIYESNTYELDFLDNIDVTFPNQTITAQTNNPFRLTSLAQCRLAFALGTFRAGTANASAAARTYTSIGSTSSAKYVLLNANGQDISGGSQLQYPLMRYLHSTRTVPGQLFTNLPIVPFLFSSPIKSLAGVDDGDQDFTGYEQTAYIPDSNFTTGTYTYDLWSFWKRRLTITNGICSVANAI